MKCSVVIPLHNQLENARSCLAALNASTYSPHQLILVDDGSDVDFRTLAADTGAELVRLDAPPRGPAFARNRGAETATGDLLIFVDSDVAVHKDALTVAVGTLERDPSLAACFGSYDDAPTAQGLVSQYRNLLHHFVHQASGEEAVTFWAGCGAIRRDIFWEVGGFDESYGRPMIEDIELGYRLNKAGRRIRLVKEFQCKHLKRWSFLMMVKADVFYRAIPWTRLILRESGFINDLNVRPAQRVSVAAAWILAACLAGAPFLPWLLAPCAAAALVLLGLNLDFYRLMTRRRGILLAIASIPLHWMGFCYSGAAFALGVAEHVLKRNPRDGSGTKREATPAGQD